MLKVPSPGVVQVVILQNCAVPAIVKVLDAQMVASAPALTTGSGVIVSKQVATAVEVAQSNDPVTVSVSVTVPVSPNAGI